MRAATSSKSGIRAEQLKAVARGMGEKFTDRKQRPWHLELAISFTIAGLGVAIILASAQVA